MTEPFADSARITGYHAHLYYDPETRPVAERLRQAISDGFEAQLGSWHDGPVGPHTVGMYQVSFAIAEFPKFVPWLMLNHEGLSVLVHPLTDDAYADHSAHALWLGEKLPLRLDILRRAEPARV